MKIKTIKGESDVFILLHPKDMSVLPYCINSIVRYVRPKVRKITVVSEKLYPELKKIFEKHNVSFLKESFIFPGFKITDMEKITYNGEDRRGWYFQQFLKWEIARTTDAEHYVVVDADTVFIKPINFIKDNKYVFYRSNQYNRPYFETYKKLFGYLPEREQSFISNFMIFNSEIVKKIIFKIEKKYNNKKKWYEIVLENINRSEQSAFSEYETFGYFASKHYPDLFLSKPALNLNLFRFSKNIKLHPIVKTLARLAGFNSVSYHNYNRNRF